MRPMRRVTFGEEDNPQFSVDFIRVRDEGDCVRLSTKEFANEAKGIKFQRELDILVNDFDRTVRLLEIAGLKKSLYQESKREQWKLKNSEVCIDLWPHIKSYIEIESPDEGELRTLAKLLDMPWESHVNGGAILLYMREYSWDKDEAMKYVKRLLFDEPLQRIE